MTSTVPDVVDGTVVEDTPTASTSTTVARRERRSEVIRPLDGDQLVESFSQYQQLLPRLLDGGDWQGKPGADGSFVKKSGWRKIATAFDLDVQIVSSLVDRAPDGTPMRCEVVARAIAPSGRAMDGDGYCSADESRFARQGGRAKLENDLRATATTRAKNRAIADLVGMGAVSAEEVAAGGASQPAAPQAPPWAQYATPEAWKTLGEAWQALGLMCGADDNVLRISFGALIAPFQKARPAGLVAGLIDAIKVLDAAPAPAADTNPAPGADQ